MMVTCKKAGPLLEKEEFEKLPFMKRVGLKMHLAWCKLCKRYKKDSGQLNDIIKTANHEYSDMQLSEEEKQAIKSQLAAES